MHPFINIIGVYAIKINVLFITVLAVIAGADDFDEIALYAKEKQSWLKSFLKLPKGIPSHDTFNRVISMDGKTVFNPEDKGGNKKAIHMVSALASKYGLVLGQQKCYEKSNEITAIPALLKMLLVEGSIITIDAMGCHQKNIAKTIRGKKADYILAVKSNSGKMPEASLKLLQMFSVMEKKLLKIAIIYLPCLEMLP